MPLPESRVSPHAFRLAIGPPLIREYRSPFFIRHIQSCTKVSYYPNSVFSEI
jgi:hypothetical protein